MNPPATTEAHNDEQSATTHTDSPKVVEMSDQANAPTVHRQSPGVTQEVGPDQTVLPAAVQRTAATLLEKAAVVRSLKGKEKEWTAVAEKKRPLQLLDLPVDILKEIIEKVCQSLHHHELYTDRHSFLTRTTSHHFRYAIQSFMRSRYPTSTLAST